MKELKDSLLELHNRINNSAKISAVIIVKNEFEVFKKCIKSIAKQVDEIIVYGTAGIESMPLLEHADSMYSARTIDGEFHNDFARCRNSAKGFAQHPWILSIDADEELLELDNDYFKNIIQAHTEGDVAAILINICNKMLINKKIITNTYQQARLSRKELNWHGRLHEDFMQEIHEKRKNIISAEKAIIEHSGYLSEFQKIAKRDRNLAILDQWISDEPVNFLPYYHRARTRLLFNNDISNLAAFNDIAQSLELIPENYYNSIDIYLLAIQLGMSTNHNLKALQYAAMALERHPTLAFLHYWKGLIHHKLQDRQNSKHEFNKALELLEANGPTIYDNFSPDEVRAFLAI